MTITAKDKAEKIAKKWGWEFDELIQFLSDGGGKGITGVSAAQAGHAIIVELMK